MFYLRNALLDRIEGETNNNPITTAANKVYCYDLNRKIVQNT